MGKEHKMAFELESLLIDYFAQTFQEFHEKAKEVA